MRAKAISTLTAMALAACTVCAAAGGRQAKGVRQAKGDPPPDEITGAYVRVSGHGRHYDGVHSGMEYHAVASGSYIANGNRLRSYTLPQAARWTFHARINDQAAPLEFRFAFFDKDRGSAHWAFTPVEEGEYELVATATHMGKACQSNTVRFHVLPPRDWAAPVSLFNNGEPAPGGEIPAGRQLLDESGWGHDMPFHAQGPVCLKWHTKSAAGSFIDGGGRVRYVAIHRNNNLMSLDPGELPDGEYSLSIPCEQEGPDGRVHTVTHEFTVKVM